MEKLGLSLEGIMEQTKAPFSQEKACEMGKMMIELI